MLFYREGFVLGYKIAKKNLKLPWNENSNLSIFWDLQLKIKLNVQNNIFVVKCFTNIKLHLIATIHNLNISQFWFTGIFKFQFPPHLKGAYSIEKLKYIRENIKKGWFIFFATTIVSLINLNAKDTHKQLFINFSEKIIFLKIAYNYQNLERQFSFSHFLYLRFLCALVGFGIVFLPWSKKFNQVMCWCILLAILFFCLLQDWLNLPIYR